MATPCPYKSDDNKFYMNNEKQNLICEPKIDKKTHKQLLVCSYKIGAQPGKHLSHPIKMIFSGTYFKDRSGLHKILDALVLGALALTIFGLIYLSLPKFTPNFIDIQASVAPSEITTGGSSTLTFRFENTSDETIRDVKLQFEFPVHFLVSSIESPDATGIELNTYDLGDIAPTQYGTIHIKGTMFGDVGSEQTFTTILTFTYGENNTTNEKRLEHIFTPTKSTLKLDLSLPEYMIANQQINGEISYINTGDVTFPDIAITPTWPESFKLISSDPALRKDKAFHATGIDPGDTGIISFVGILGDTNDSTFTFTPAFEFADASYIQDILRDFVKILPSPLEISHSASSVITPGDTATFNISYKNTSSYPLRNVIIRLSANNGIFSTAKMIDGYYVADSIDEIAPNESGSAQISIPVHSTFASSLGVNISLQTKSSAEFTFKPDGIDIETNTFGNTLSTPVSSPISLSSFGRYWTANGDQLGRGFLPPRVGETTKIWVFWNLTGTTNELSNMKIEADLGQGVTFTGRQSVSAGSAVYSQNGSVIWSVGQIAPTNTGTVIGAAFEVEIAPVTDQIGTSPILIYAPYVSAKDTFTGAVISDAGESVTTNLTADTKALEFGGVVIE